MAYQNDSGAAAHQLLHALFTLLLEQKVAHSQNFVRNQHIGLCGGGHGKGKARHHAGGIVLQRNIKKIAQLAEFYNFVEIFADVLRRHAQHCAVQKNIFAGGEVKVKPGAQLNQRRNGAAHRHAARRGLEHAGNHF